MWKGGFDKSFTRDQFRKHVADLKWTGWRPRFITLHHTGAPTLKQWIATPGGEAQRMKNLRHYYQNQKGWSAAPHLFIGPELIWLGTPLTESGVHAVSFNTTSIGIEMAGNYDVEPFDPRVRDLAVFAMAVLHSALGITPTPFQLRVRGLHFHRDDPLTTKTCPGTKVSKDDLVKRIADAMGANNPGSADPSVEDDYDTTEEIQAALNRHGAKPALDIDGDYGAKTRKAMLAFQKAKGIAQTGTADTASVAALKKKAA